MNVGVGYWRERVDYAISNLRFIHVTLLSYARAKDQAQTILFNVMSSIIFKCYGLMKGM